MTSVPDQTLVGPVPRGRHAPPLEVRRQRQRARLHHAAAAVFSRVGFAAATAEAISREARMSKATFYEHFDDVEGCFMDLFGGVLGRHVTTDAVERLVQDVAEVLRPQTDVEPYGLAAAVVELIAARHARGRAREVADVA